MLWVICLLLACQGVTNQKEKAADEKKEEIASETTHNTLSEEEKTVKFC